VSLRIFESTNDSQLVCWILNNLGVLLLKEGDYEGARDSFERAIEISRSRGDLMSEGILEENRAELELIHGKSEEAFAAISRAHNVAEQRKDDLRRAAALKLLGAYQRMVGRPEDAIDTLRQALTLSAVGEDALLGAEVLYQFGLALDAAGQAESAREVWGAALEAFERIAARQWVGRVKQRLSTGSTGRYL
jgi:tetratricopeptide (TPR) repeat protein